MGELLESYTIGNTCPETHIEVPVPEPLFALSDDDLKPTYLPTPELKAPKSQPEEQKNTHDEGPRLKVNQRRSQVRKLIDLVTSFYTPLLRTHT